MKNDQRWLEWPAGGVTRAPFGVMSDPEIYAQERERIFRGPVWNYLCLEAEITEPGFYRTAYIGDTPVIAARDQDGSIHAMVDRCAHKDALRGVPFQNGVGGKGGMPEDFDLAQHGLERLRAESFHGLVFATFSDAAEPLETYLGRSMAAHVRRVFHKPIEVLGYHGDGIIVAIQSIFPSCVHQQIYNTLALPPPVRAPPRSACGFWNGYRSLMGFLTGDLNMDNEMLRRQIEALHTRYIQSIDEDKLEEWHGLFTETGLYKIVTRENFDQGLPLAVMECRSRGMMQDREERIVVPDSRRIETLLVIPL